MVPVFNQQKSIGPQLRDQSEQTLDNYTGSRSLHINKKETAPLFRPEDNIQWANGSPDSSEFYQSRVNPSLRYNNVKPFEQVYVGPGINKGFSNEGSGGFNSGMEGRSVWIPKTVDELRAVNNPKSTEYNLSPLEGPAQSLVKNLGIEGKMEKHLPDKFYINTGTERMLTTTGAEIAATLRAIQPDPTIHRATTSQSYAGAAGNAGGAEQQPQHGMYRMDHRQQLSSEKFTPAGTSVQQNNLTTIKGSILIPPTNRTHSTQATGNLQGIVSALTAPLTDILRPTRKEWSHLNRLGNAGSTVSEAPSMDTAPAKTIRDSTTYSPYDKGQRPFLATMDGGYKVTDHQPIENQRTTTSVAYMGIGGSTMPQPVSYEDSYNATISSNRSAGGRTPGGVITTFQPHMKTQQSSTKIENLSSYTGNAKSINSLPPSMQSQPVRNPQQYAEPDRNTGDLLTAFKQNPYTHSLHSI
jgi:hypothetical protein